MNSLVAALLPRLARVFAAVAALALLPPLAAQAAVVVEGTYSIAAPERRAIPFRMVLTPTGARITPAQGETLIFSYAKKSALIVDRASRTYFLLPLELVPTLLAAGLGYDPRGLGAAVSGVTKRFLDTPCEEVTVSGKAPRFTLQSCRVADPGSNSTKGCPERSAAWIFFFFASGCVGIVTTRSSSRSTGTVTRSDSSTGGRVSRPASTRPARISSIDRVAVATVSLMSSCGCTRLRCLRSGGKT